jgi:secreted Zn-dependent insulinase-like peptidase
MERVEAFLPQFLEEKLSGMEAEVFDRHRKSLVTNLNEPHKTLISEASSHWGEIVNGTLEWDRSRVYAEEVRWG